MGLRGPPPKPSALKRLEGTYRPDRAAENEVVAPPGEPPMPDGLPDEAVKRWKELVPVLLLRCTLSVEDGAILEAHCRAYAMSRTYAALAEKAPLVRAGKHGGVKVNPAASEARAWETRATQTGSLLGLNASSRSRVSARDVAGGPSMQDQDDPAADFLFGPPKLVKKDGE